MFKGLATLCSINWMKYLLFFTHHFDIILNKTPHQHEFGVRGLDGVQKKKN